MKVDLIRYTPCPAALVGEAAAICTASENYERARRGAMASGHLSVTEHANFTFRIEGVSRVLLAQLTRHRIASFSVQSQRYCGADMRLVIPDSMAHPDLVDDLVNLKRLVMEVYKKAVGLGVPEEDARYFTLQAGQTELIMTMNARELLHFFELRCCARAQWEIRELADRMLASCRHAAPELFRHAGCACMQGLPCPEGKLSCGHPRRSEEAL